MANTMGASSSFLHSSQLNSFLLFIDLFIGGGGVSCQGFGSTMAIINKLIAIFYISILETNREV